MKDMRSFAVMLAFVPLLAVAVSVGAFSTSQSDSLDGKKVFLDNKCNMCHSVSGADIESKVKSGPMKGPDLSGVVKSNKDEFLTQFLRKEAELNGKKHQKAFVGTDEELGALLAWLHTLSE